jgi:hypothetical protein
MRAAVRAAAALGPLVGIADIPDRVATRSLQRVVREACGWRVQPDRKGRLRLDRVALVAPEPSATDAEHPQRRVLESVEQLTPADAAFVLGAGTRSWPALRARYGASAWERALDLVRASVVVVMCDVGDDLRLSQPRGWALTLEAAELADARAARSAHARAGDSEALDATLTALERARATDNRGDSDSSAAGTHALGPEALDSLCEALRASRPGTTRQVLLAVAADVLSGARHDGPRAFALAHFAHSKDRDDVAARLSDVGVAEGVAAALGVLRAPRLGVCGDILVLVPPAPGTHVAGEPGEAVQRLPVAGLSGPTLLRTDTPGLDLLVLTGDLVVVENLQAAEALDAARRAGDLPVAILYSAGQPGPDACRLIASAAEQAERVLLCPDADLGGVRIASAVLTALSERARERTQVCDIGAWPHRPQQPWPAEGESVRGLCVALDGPVAQLARACLARGYRVEQEHAVVAAVRQWHAGGP